MLASTSDALDLVFQVGVEALAFVCMHYQRRPVIQHLSSGVVFLMLDNLDVHVVGVLLGETLLQVDVWAPFVKDDQRSRCDEVLDDPVDVLDVALRKDGSCATTSEISLHEGLVPDLRTWLLLSSMMLLKDKTDLVSLDDLAGATELLHPIEVLLTLVAEDGKPVDDGVLAQLKLTNSKTVVIITGPHVQQLKQLTGRKFGIREDGSIEDASFFSLVKGASPYNVISTPLHHERHRLVDALWTPDTSIFDEPIVRKELQNITVVHHKYLTHIESL